jgi:RNA polymerase sigma-70 factor (ECF subfamily)
MPGGCFAQTHWTLVFEAARAGTPEARDAFGRLYQAYWQPVCGLIWRRGASASDAEDLGQEFFADLLARNALEGLHPEYGRFRSFLIASLKNFLANAHDRAQAQKRGGGIAHVSMDAGLAEGHLPSANHGTAAEALFDADWARTVANRVLARLDQEYQESGRGALFRELREFLGGGMEPRSHAEVAHQHGITVNAVGVAIHRLRRRYGELLREEVTRTVSRPEEVKDEIRHLLAVIEQCPGGLAGCVPGAD